ncbi:MAG: hypothetical protein ACLUGF_08900 [Clostridium sp.]
MRKIKKMGALITAAALTVTLIGTAADASAFSKTKYGFTLSGDHSISKTKGSAWGSVKPQSYVSIASVYKYKNKNNVVKQLQQTLQEQEIPQELIGVIQSLVENPLVLRQNGQVFIRKKL